MNQKRKTVLMKTGAAVLAALIFFGGLVYGSMIVENRRDGGQVNSTATGTVIGENSTHVLVAWCDEGFNSTMVNASNWQSDKVQSKCRFTLEKNPENSGNEGLL